MAWVQTTAGVHVNGKSHNLDRSGTLTLAQAERDAEKRNKQAEKLGIPTRYEVVE